MTHAVLTDNHIELLLSWSTFGIDAKTRVLCSLLLGRSVLLINAGLMEMVLPSKSFKGGPRPSALCLLSEKGLFYAAEIVFGMLSFKQTLHNAFSLHIPGRKRANVKRTEAGSRIK